jgi:hypothetical protein
MKTRQNKSQTLSLEDQRKAASREALKTTPGLAETLMKIAGCENYENGRMGVPTSEELEAMCSRGWTPRQRRSFVEGSITESRRKS